jgi:FkbM family methyltransferase
VLAVFSDNFKSVPLTIVDAGANIGLTTLFFKSANQDVRVISIEPDPQNHAQASKNFQENLLQSVHLQQLALWPKSERLNIVNDFRDKQEWSLRVEVSDHGLIKTITPLEAILFLGETVDIFKMDIEGGEFEIFNIENDLSWLNRIKVIALEIHEEYGAAEKINAVLTNYGFTLHYHGELTVGINSAFLKINQK